MPIGFNEVPAGIRVPFLYAEFDNSNAVQGAGTQPYKTLMIAQRLSTGTKPELEKHLITSKEQAAEYFGAGSQAALMAEKYLEINRFNELHIISQDDAAAGVAATGNLLFTGSVTKAGVLKVYIAGQKVEVGVAVGDSLAQIATNFQAAAAAISSLPVSSAVNGGVAEQVDLTAKNKGVAGNDIDLRLNYFTGDELPEGLGVTITAMANGVANPDVQEAIDILDDEQFILWVTPYADASNLLAIETELAKRFGPITQNDGYHITGSRGTLSELNAVGDSRNSQFTIIKRASGPTTFFEQAAVLVAVVAAAAQIDPARPFQTLALPGILAESESEKLTLEERNILLNHGIDS